jgi:hypothetical protein
MKKKKESKGPIIIKEKIVHTLEELERISNDSEIKEKDIKSAKNSDSDLF